MGLRHKIYMTFALMVLAGTFCFSAINEMIRNMPSILGLDAYSVFIGIIYFVLSAGIMEYFVLFRIEQLQKELNRAKKDKFLSAEPLFFYSKDELGSVVHDINHMIKELNNEREEIKTKNKLYLSLVNEKFIYVCRFKPNGKITFINKTFSGQFNQDHKELLNKDLYRLFESVGFEAKEIKENIAILNPSKTSSNLIYDMPKILEESSPRWIAWTVSAAFNEKGVPLEYQIVGIDMRKTTSKSESEESLQKNTILLSIDGRIDYMFNPFTEESSIGEKLLDYTHESDRHMIEKAVSRILLDKNESVVNIRLKAKDKYVYTQMSFSFSVDKDDYIKNIVIHAIDITEIQGAQEKVVGAVNYMHKILDKNF